ncbi:ABC transporter substrate-binding protein [Endothiovibrio diazotrophicus]
MLLLLLLFTLPALAAPPSPVLLGFDGAYGLHNSTSARAIEQGMRVAIDEINAAGGVLGGRPLALITSDNRSVPARGIDNIRAFAQQQDLVAVFGGRFSPVLLQQLPVVHGEKVILADVWGSADRITDHDYHPSYTFRLSLRDAYAMPTMLRHATAKGAARVGLLLPNTGWGRSNEAAARRFSAIHPRPAITTYQWYNWGEESLLHQLRALRAAGAEALVVVANDVEGSILVREMAALPPAERMPIISHWGVTGGHFVENCGAALHQVDFSVVQTFSLFRADPTIRERVMAAAKRLFEITAPEQVEAPVGFGHAYDMVHLLARAIDAADTTDRPAVRDALERIGDYHGLVRDYHHPFGPDDHDALDPEDVFMAHYDEHGVLRPLP